MRFLLLAKVLLQPLTWDGKVVTSWPKLAPPHKSDPKGQPIKPHRFVDLRAAAGPKTVEAAVVIQPVANDKQVSTNPGEKPCLELRALCKKFDVQVTAVPKPLMPLVAFHSHPDCGKRGNFLLWFAGTHYDFLKGTYSGEEADLIGRSRTCYKALEATLSPSAQCAVRRLAPLRTVVSPGLRRAQSAPRFASSCSRGEPGPSRPLPTSGTS